MIKVVGQMLRAVVERSAKPGKVYLKSIEEDPKVAEPAAAQTAEPNATATPKEPLLAGAEKSPYHEVAERIAAEGTHEQWVPQNTLRLSHLSDKSLRILLVRWPNLLEAAKEEEKGIAPEKTA